MSIFCQTYPIKFGIIKIYSAIIIGKFCDVPIINKEEKDDDLGSHSIALKDLTKEEEIKIEQEKKKNNCCGGGKKTKKTTKKGKN